MKKLLLLAAVAMVFGASAQTLTQDWKHDVTASIPYADCRQGIGLGGKIYINNKSNQTVYVFGESGEEATTLPGGANTAISIDQAGHLVVGTATFPGSWTMGSPVLKVYDPATPDVVTEISIPNESLQVLRCDWIGRAVGDLTGDGEFYYSGTYNETIGNDKLHKLVVIGGEASADDSYAPVTTGNLTFANSQAYFSAFVDGVGETAETKLFSGLRGELPSILVPDGDNFIVEKTLSIPVAPTTSTDPSVIGKNNLPGRDIFNLGKQQFVIYTVGKTNGDYTDGFCIAKIGDEIETVVTHESTGSTASNQIHFLNAEVIDQHTAYIYQYVGNSYVAKYTFSLPNEQPTGISDVTAKKAEVKKVIENGQIYIINGDAKYNVMGAQVK